MRGDISLIPPRNGEEDRRPQAGGGGASPAVLRASARTVRLARERRRSGNLPEVLLWRALRRRPQGLKFRRQFPAGRYVLDFACLSARLAIEIDGAIHERGDRPGRDERRDAELTALGFSVLRLPATLILHDLDAALTAVAAACATRAPLHPRAAPGGPPPRTGEV